MPTRGYGTFRLFLISSVTSKVLDDIGCPVLTGAHMSEKDAAEKQNILNVVCAIDLGPSSSDAPTWAVQFASDFQNTLSIVHATPHLDPSLKIALSSDEEDRMETSTREEIERLQTAVGAKNIAVCIEKGEVTHVVCSYARSVGAAFWLSAAEVKMIEPAGCARNAYDIIRQSACPVLSV